MSHATAPHARTAHTIPTIAILVVLSDDNVILIRHPDSDDYDFVSIKITDVSRIKEEVADAARRKLGLELKEKSLALVKVKQRRGVRYVSYARVIGASLRKWLEQFGPEGDEICVVSKHELPDYVEQGRYDMAVARTTGIR